jgi:hypothetical protein
MTDECIECGNPVRETPITEGYVITWLEALTGRPQYCAKCVEEIE